MKIVGITGGTGSGKSTLAVELLHKFQGKATYLSMDDYFKRSSNIERDENGTINWDSAQALDFDKFYLDILKLKSGEKIEIMSKSKFYNPNFEYKIYEKKQVEIEPKDILILEGFMLFYDKRIRDLLGLKVYLDLDIDTALGRRDNDKHKPDKDYQDRYLIPNQLQNIEPTKKYADLVIDTKKEDIVSSVNMVVSCFKKMGLF
jgi:uridine kinase